MHKQTDEGLELTEITEGSPAEEAGLEVGDVIVSVNGEKAAGKEHFELFRLFRGPAGTKFTFEVTRGDETFEVEVEKRMLL